MQKLSVAYSNTIRKLLGYSRFYSASGILVEINLASFQCLRRRAVYLVYGYKVRIVIYYYSICAVQYTGGPN